MPPFFRAPCAVAGAILALTACPPRPAEKAACGNAAVEGEEQCDDGNAVGLDGCERDCTITTAVEVKTCAAGAGSLPASGTCQVSRGDGNVLLTSTVLADGVVFVGGQVLVDATGTVICAECDCASQSAAAQATHVLCAGTVLSPGLINAHDHISFQADPAMGTVERYEHRHDWRKGNNGHTAINNGGNATNAQIRWAELRQLMAGTTSIVGATYTTNGNSGLLRNLDSTVAGQLSPVAGANGVQSDTFPLGDSSGLELTQGCGYPSVPTSAVIPSDSAYLPHVAEGIEASARNEFVCLSQANGLGVLGARTALVHGIGLKAADVALVAKTGTSLVWSPRSNVSLYGDTAAIPLYQNQGVNIALGTDWTISGSMNLLRELRCADALNRERFDGAISDVGLWRMVTAGGADATATPSRLGRIAAGHLADLAIYRLKDSGFFRSVIEAEPQDVVMTMRGGKVLYGDAALVGAFDSEAKCEAIEVCGSAKAACIRGELPPLGGDNAGDTLALLQQANTKTYPLFFCGKAPTNEPSCVPERAASNAKEGSGAYLAGDSDFDKDGVSDDSDNCPRVFNPVRPMDEGVQGDVDRDGVGDVCDVCPLDPNETSCRVFDPSDRDGDGQVNNVDNCPFEPNPKQEDRDSDGKGDACDACPVTPNPGSAACPATIYAIKRTEVPQGQKVSLNRVLVTGTGGSGFFLQVHETDPEYVGREHSGVFFFLPNAGVKPGDRLAIPQASWSNYFGQIQLSGGGPAGADGGIVVLSSGNALPEPVVRSPSALASADAGWAEGVLVRIEDVTVVNTEPDAGLGDRAPINEFVVSGGLRINDGLHLIDPFPLVGQQFSSITGVLDYRNGDFKLEPRDSSDFRSGPATLVAFRPATGFVRVGATGAMPTPFEVRVSNPESSPLEVVVTSSGPEVAVADGGLVIIPAGSVSTQVPIIGVSSTFGNTVKLVATLRGLSREASVRVLGTSEMAVLDELKPSAVSVMAGSSATFEVLLDVPSAVPMEVAIEVSPTTLGTAPAVVAVPAETMGATFVFSAASEGAGSGTVTVAVGGVSRSAAVTVTALPVTKHVVISEFSPRGPGGGFDEFVELHNPMPEAVDVSGWVLQTKSAAASSPWVDRVTFPGNTALASHRYLLTANASGYRPDAGSGPPADFAWGAASGGMGDTGAIRLIRTVDQVVEVIDAVAFGSTSTGGEGVALPPHGGSASPLQSFERKARPSSTEASMTGSGADVARGNALDTDVNASDFYLRSSTQRQPQNLESPQEP